MAAFLATALAGAADVTAKPSPPAAPGLLDYVSRETDAVMDMLAGGGAGGLLLLGLLLALVTLWLTLAVRRRRRSGTGNISTFSSLLVGLRLLTAAIIVSALLRYLFDRAKVFAAVVLLFGAAGALLSLGLAARRWLAGVLHVLRRTIHEGDRLTVGDVDGTVERLGLFRLLLRRDDGARMFLPVGALADQSFTVSSPEQSFPVEVLLGDERPLVAADRTRLALAAKLCPYRESGSDVHVEPAEGGRVLVRLRCWSAAAAARAEAYLRVAVSELSPERLTVDASKATAQEAKPLIELS